MPKPMAEERGHDGVIAWLLEEDNPCTRFLTLTQLLLIAIGTLEVARIPKRKNLDTHSFFNSSFSFFSRSFSSCSA